ncbi:MAG: DNA polymerase ligase N-terminal domain-containing protein [Parcubacteria group bacterium]
MSLQKYKSKRRFSVTEEPKPVRKRKKTGSLIFVVQEHHASHLHYDFRLEWKGVLLSWAVPKKPSNSGTKRLAVQVEDHPVDYASFEGEIPKGEYGAGTVKIWDRGIWLPESVEKDKIVFELRGQKLVGPFALIRLKGQGKNWLFFRLK